MYYYIIEKLHIVEGVLTYTPVGYVTNQDTMYKCIDSTSISLINNWLEENKNGLNTGNVTLTDFVDLYGIDSVYVSTTVSNYLPASDLMEITDIHNFTEGV